MLCVVRVESVCVSELRCALAVMAPARSAWQDRQAGILSWALRREPSGEREREREASMGRVARPRRACGRHVMLVGWALQGWVGDEHHRRRHCHGRGPWTASIRPESSAGATRAPCASCRSRCCAAAPGGTVCLRGIHAMAAARHVYATSSNEYFRRDASYVV